MSIYNPEIPHQILEYSILTAKYSGSIVKLYRRCRKIERKEKDFSKELGEEVFITVTGNLDSVLDRVNDPFFGLDTDNIDMNDPEIKAFLKNLESQPAPDSSTVGTHSITLSIESLVTQESQRSVLKTLTRTAGAKVTFTHGYCFNWPWATTWILPATPLGKVDCTFYTKPLWGGSWSKNTKANNITLADGGVKLQGSSIGWYNWKVSWHWETDANILTEMIW